MSPRADFGTIEQRKPSLSGKEKRRAKQKEAARGKLPSTVVVCTGSPDLKIRRPGWDVSSGVYSGQFVSAPT